MSPGTQEQIKISYSVSGPFFQESFEIGLCFADPKFSHRRLGVRSHGQWWWSKSIGRTGVATCSTHVDISKLRRFTFFPLNYIACDNVAHDTPWRHLSAHQSLCWRACGSLNAPQTLRPTLPYAQNSNGLWYVTNFSSSNSID